MILITKIWPNESLTTVPLFFPLNKPAVKAV